MGWNTIFKRCLDVRIFDTPGLSAYASVFHQPIETVLTLLNIENGIV